MNKMTEKRILKLSPLEGNPECFLEVEYLLNGDVYVTLSGQDKKGNYYTVSAQIPCPMGGGGNIEDYKVLRKIYDVMRRTNKRKKK